MATIEVQLTRRLGAARVLLQGVAGTQRHAAVSNIQKVAVLELLTDALASQRLSGEDLARYNDQIMEAQWAHGHQDELLHVLSKKATPKRRKQQNFSASTAYLSNNYWVRFLDPYSDLNAKADFLTCFNAIDLDCVNPTEPTYKRWVSDIFVAHFAKDDLRGLSLSSKYALLDYVKKAHKRVAKNRTAEPEIYLLELPSNPKDLRQCHPAMYNRLFPDCEPVRNRLDESTVMQIDASFQCRGGLKSTTPMSLNVAPSPSSPLGDQLAQLLPQLMQGFAAMINGGSHGGSPQLVFDGPGSRAYTNGSRRSLKALENSPGHEERPRYRGGNVEPPPPAGPVIMEAPSSSSAGRSAPAAPVEAAEDVEPAAPVDVAEDDDSSDDPDAKSPGDVMLNAIIARDAAVRKEAAEKAAALRLAKKLAAAKEKADAQAAAHSLETDEVASATLKKRKSIAMKAAPAAIPVEAPAKKAMKATPVLIPVDHEAPAKKAKLDGAPPTKPTLPTHEGGAAKPSASHEASRWQWLCRTGVKGEPTQKFRYKMKNGDAGVYPNEAAAKKAAQAWVKARMPKLK